MVSYNTTTLHYITLHYITLHIRMPDHTPPPCTLLAHWDPCASHWASAPSLCCRLPHPRSTSDPRAAPHRSSALSCTKLHTHTHTHTVTHTRSHTQSHTHSHTHTVTQSHTQSHTRSHSHTHTHSYSDMHRHT
jgi:hypothetical protein